MNHTDISKKKISIAVLVDKDIPTDHSFLQGVLEKSMYKENCEVTFIGYPSGLKPVAPEGAKFITVDNPPDNFFKKKYHKVVNFINKIKEAGPFDVLYTRNDPVYLIIAWHLKKAGVVKLHFHQISHLHAFASARGNTVYKIKSSGDIFLRKIFLKYADCIMLISEQMKSFLDKEWPQFKSKYLVYPLGIEVGDFKDSKPYNQRNYEVVYIGTLAASRKVDVIIDAIRIYNEKYGNLEMHIWGGSHNKQDDIFVKNHAKKAGLENKIHFYGKIGRLEVLEKLKDTKIGLSTIPNDGILNQISPTKLMEYLAAGCCVVATGGIKDQEDIIQGAYGENPIVFEANAIADAIYTILNDNDKANQLSLAGREYIFENRSYSQMAKQLRSEMEELLN